MNLQKKTGPRINYRKMIGNNAETLACEFLMKKGYVIIGRNYRAHRNEIDIIARLDKMIIFVEVKSKNSNSLTSPEYSITEKKQKIILEVANRFIEKNQLFNLDYRFDVIFIYYEKISYKIKHIENAFMCF